MLDELCAICRRWASSFERGGYRFEVVDMDGRRVDKVMVSKLSEG